jgi:hypothetical protein
MIRDSQDTSRRLIPRWRGFQRTIQFRETNSNEALPKRELPDAYWQTKLLEWQTNPCIETAAPLIEAATVLGRAESAAGAVEFILNENTPAVATVKWLAGSLLNRAQRREDVEHVASRSPFSSQNPTLQLGSIA